MAVAMMIFSATGVERLSLDQNPSRNEAPPSSFEGGAAGSTIRKGGGAAASNQRTFASQLAEEHHLV
jgi:hypothetical protein